MPGSRYIDKIQYIAQQYRASVQTLHIYCIILVPIVSKRGISVGTIFAESWNLFLAS